MFLLFGIDHGEKQLSFSQLYTCPVCGRYSRIEVWMVYSVFTLFFLPIFKWGRRYFAKTACCGATCTLDSELGARIARGENVVLKTEDLHFHGEGRGRTCPQCGYSTSEDFQYCPKCGSKF